MTQGIVLGAVFRQLQQSDDVGCGTDGTWCSSDGSDIHDDGDGWASLNGSKDRGCGGDSFDVCSNDWVTEMTKIRRKP